jgi:hypothetical protein
MDAGKLNQRFASVPNPSSQAYPFDVYTIDGKLDNLGWHQSRLELCPRRTCARFQPLTLVYYTNRRPARNTIISFMIAGCIRGTDYKFTNHNHEEGWGLGQADHAIADATSKLDWLHRVPG